MPRKKNSRKKTAKKSKRSSKEEDILQQILDNEKEILSKEDAQLSEDKTIEADEEAQLEELRELEDEIKEDIERSPLGKITFRDFTKSLIGALFGVLGHFAYAKGPSIAKHISMTRATSLFLVSLLVCVLFVYFAGFRKIDKKYITWLPIRVGVIYITSLLVIVMVLFLFGDISTETPWTEAYKIISTITLLAVLGASAADLVGKDE